jgi:hypothetical protein
MTKPLVTIHNDDEGMFGGMSSAEIAEVDVDATLAAYDLELTKALRADMPEIEVVLVYGPYGGRSIHVVSELSEQEEYDISISVGEIVAQVYERGTFWTVRSEVLKPPMADDKIGYCDQCREE